MSKGPITAEMCYAEWHRVNQLSKGIRVRAMKNFEKARSKDTWMYFEKLATLCNRNAGRMDYKLYFAAMSEQYSGYIPPNVVSTMKSLKIYKSYVRSLNLNNDPQAVTDSVLTSFKFVIEYMHSRELENLDMYLMEGCNIIPTILKHYNAGSVSIHFLCCINNFNTILASFPADVIAEYIPNFEEEYVKYRSRLMGLDDKVVQLIINNLEVLVKRALEVSKTS
jgi:hypothetical protein